MTYTYADLVRDMQAGVHPIQHMQHDGYPNCEHNEPEPEATSHTNGSAT